MNSDQVIQYLKRLPGVAGAFVIDPAGQILAADVPPIFDEDAVEAMATDGTNAIETLRSELSTCYELRIDTGLMTVLIRDLSGSLLFVLVDQAEEVSSIRIAANVTSKRYSPDVAEASSTAAESSSGSVFSLSPKKKEQPKKKDKPDAGGSIWG